MKSRNAGIPKGFWALLASWKPKANDIPRKHPRQRPASLAWCHSIPVSDIWQCHDCGWAMPYINHQGYHWERTGGRPVTRRKDLMSLGRRRKGFFRAKEIRAHLPSACQKHSQLLGPAMWNHMGIICYSINGTWIHNARAWATVHLTDFLISVNYCNYASSLWLQWSYWVH